MLELSDKAAVERAMAVYKDVGREAFLDEYKHGGSNGFFILRDQTWFESRSVLAAAYATQFPDRAPLDTKDLDRVSELALVCERLGFDFRSRVSEFPHQIGDEYPSRKALKDWYGGDIYHGSIVLPDEETVNIFSSDDGPYADDPPLTP